MGGLGGISETEEESTSTRRQTGSKRNCWMYCRADVPLHICVSNLIVLIQQRSRRLACAAQESCTAEFSHKLGVHGCCVLFMRQLVRAWCTSEQVRQAYFLIWFQEETSGCTLSIGPASLC